MAESKIPEEIKRFRPGACTEIKLINGHYYVYMYQSLQLPSGKWGKKTGKCIGTIIPGKGFIPNRNYHLYNGEKSQDEITNLLLVNYNVEQLDKILTKDDQIERMFINFCNPWPRERHKKRRLTFPRKLEMYKTFLKKDAEIRFKTDDDELFEESVEYFEQSGYDIKFITRDLHAENIADNIVTEHERMFTEEGKKIKFLIAVQSDI